MRRDHLLPTYEQLFGALDFRAVDEGRSVYSPAAYLADLLRLIDDEFAENPLTATDRRSDITRIPLDGEHTYTESPYLDVVNRVLATVIGPDADQELKTQQFPFAMPFDLDREKVRRYLRHFRVGPVELYELFADQPDRDVVAREFLGLSEPDVVRLTTVVTGTAELLENFYGFEGSLADLQDVVQFVRAAQLTATELAAVLNLGSSAFVHQQGPRVTLDSTGKKLVWGEDSAAVPVEWFERVSRFVRLARRIGLPLAETDLVLRTCCGNTIDLSALRILAVVVHLHRGLDLPVEVIASLAAPIDGDLFERVFNEPFAAELTVITGPATQPPAGARVLSASGDILAPRNKEFRARVSRAVGLTEADLSTVVTRVRQRYPGTVAQSGPFDRAGIGLDALALLHRAGRLSNALDVTVNELFGVLDALGNEPSSRHTAATGGLLDLEPGTSDLYRMLEAPDVSSGLCLAQLLLGVVRWMQALGIDSTELGTILGGRKPDDATDQDDTAQADTDEWEALHNQLHEHVDAIGFTPEVLQSGRFGQRAAQALYDGLVQSDGVIAGDPRLLRLDPALAETAAYDAVTDLVTITEEDFRGLGLAGHLAGKIFTNLVLTGRLDSTGLLADTPLPATAARFVLSSDFTAVQQPLFALIANVCDAGADGFYPSDLATLNRGLTDAQQAELYDNLVVQRYLESSGEILDPDFFTDPANAPAFAVNVPLDDVAPEVLELLQTLVEQVRTEQVALDPAIFAEIPLTAQLRAELADTLQFNGYIDTDGYFIDPAALMRLTLDGFGLAVTFHPHRAAILRAIQGQLTETRTAGLTLTAEHFAGIADRAAAGAVAEALGAYLDDGLVPEETRPYFADPDNVVALTGSPWERLFSTEDLTTITSRIATVVTDQQPYRLDLDAVAELGFTPDETTRLVAILVARGDIHDDLSIPEDRLIWFATPSNALGYTLTGLEDYATDVFLLLHTAARELLAGITELTTVLTARAGQQRAALLGVLSDATGQPVATVEALCEGVCGSVPQAFDALLSPGGRRAYDRIRRFALLVTRLGMDATQVDVAFHDQDLAGKFAEPLLLPPGVEKIDALLESADGDHVLFSGTNWWIYPAGAEVATGPRPLAELSPRLAGLAAIDAAFTDSQGAQWVIGHDGTGSHAFTRAPGTQHWDRREQVWGTVRNTIEAQPSRIDSAFVDDEGRTYLFRGEQYVRYSGPDYTFVDEGYPRSISEWWEGEGRHTPLPDRFRTLVDASFQDRDGRVHLFTGQHCLAVGDEAGERETTEVWGRVRNALTDTGRIDAAYNEASSVVLFSGNQAVRYADSIENDGVLADEGYPQWIESQLPGVPVGFDSALAAAFADEDGVVHLFKDGRTVALERGKPATAEPTAQRWGVLSPVLADGIVDSALVGLDGMTYLFSGEKYLRYSGADYSVADLGYPRGIAGDWGGLRRVGASFVLDGATHLFGTGGLLFTLPVDHEPDLIAGTVSRAVRDVLHEHGITVAADARVTTGAGEWRLAAENSVSVVLRRVGDKIEVHADPAQQNQFHVRYSTRSYTVPDPGYPRPLTDNWWNIPDGVFGDIDAVFTGQDNRTYLFHGGQYIVFDNKRRWWSEPRPLSDRWDSLPFGHVDAAFVGKDGKTYLFSRDQYVRYTGSDYTALDDRYPAPNEAYWGTVVNNVARHGRVDATLVLGSTTYLFSGNQFVRYDGPDRQTVADGYPKSLDALACEPRLRNLPGQLGGPVEAAFADQRTAYLIVGDRCLAVSDTVYRRYEGFGDVRCAFVEDGSVLVENAQGWQHYSALEGATVAKTSVRPRALRTVPTGFRSGLDAVLRGADGNTYLFKGTTCFDVRLNREYPLAEDWGRGRHAIAQDNRVDAGFVGVDGRTYVFSGDQFVVYKGTRVVDAEIDGEPRSIAEHWAGLTSVTLAYVRAGTTYVFERPGADGTQRYLVYSGADYTAPDEGYPLVADGTFWDIPADLRPEGFTMPDAVLFEGENMLLVAGDKYLARHEVTGVWSPPRPVNRLWPGVDRDWPGALTAAFTGRDAVTYLFFPGKFTQVTGGAVALYRSIRDAWGRTRNNFVAGRVDAAYVDSGRTTFLFSGDQYVRYTGTAYRHADPGYPKLIADNLRHEDAFANLPDTFEDAVAARIESGAGSVIDAVVGNRRTVYLFVGGDCHAVSRTPYASYELSELGLGRIRNTLAERGQVDAALVIDDRTLLFSGDQYVRYSGSDHTFVDDGYPRAIETSLQQELGYTTPLPDQLRDGVDAAFRGADGGIYLFAGSYWFRPDKPGARPIAGTWGRVRNAFTDTPGIDAAFVAPTGELYVFRGGQYARYSTEDRTFVDEGFPRTVRDDWGDLPDTFEDGIDTAFVLRGRTYLGLGDQYVRYSGDGYRQIDRTYPQTFRQRWSGLADYRLEDIRVIARFAALARTHDGLAEFAAAGPGTVTDPYSRLAELFGWDTEDLRWLARRRGLLTTAPEDDRVELELLLKLADVFTIGEALGAGSATIFDIWSGLYGAEPSDAATAKTLYDLLARRHSPQDWAVLSRQVHDELNVIERDALVSAVLAKTGAENSRELFEQLLIDVDMGSQGKTSPIREAIAATQLFLHRYFLDLEEIPAKRDDQDEQVRDRLRTWWAWMRNYRVWEANRKVFLYPENYLRPELRDRKTPAFEALESDLLQGDITPAAVERAYKRYLDEYTEVSRLAIAGGHVYTAGAEDTRDLVLFGRTRTQPRRYYYRRAQFRSAEKVTAAWEPWLKVDVQIDADEVHPVHAFNRVFVFWTTIESVAAASTTTTLSTRDQGDSQEVTAPPATERVRIHYSFYNLNKEWVPAQTLAMDTRRDGSIYDVRLAVEVAGVHTDGPESIVVNCTYSVVTTTPQPTGPAKLTKTTYTQMTALTPELVAEALPVPAIGPGTQPAVAADPMPEVLAEAEIQAVAGMDAANRPQLVRFTSPSKSDYGPWFSIDHKGGSFLCRPAVVAPAEPVTPLPLLGNKVGLAEWDPIDTAVETPGGIRLFFDNTNRRYTTITNGTVEASGTIADRWGRRATYLTRTGIVDAVLRRGQKTYVFSGPQYFCYSGTFGTLEDHYPKQILGNTEGFPQWDRIEAAFTDINDVEWFHTAVGGGRIERGDALGTAVATLFGVTKPGLTRFDSAIVDTDEQLTYVFSGNEYVRFSGKDYRVPGETGKIADNNRLLPKWSQIGAALRVRNSSYYFNDAGQSYTQITVETLPPDSRPPHKPQTKVTETTTASRDLGRGVTTGGLTTVDAAYTQDNFLYLTSGTKVVRYTVPDKGPIPDVIDEVVLKDLPQAITSVVRRGTRRYVFSGGRYAQWPPGKDLSEVTGFAPIEGAWGDLPEDFADFTGLLDSESDKYLYLFLGKNYVRFPTTIEVPRPFERAALPIEIVRLTTSTAAQLNQRLLGGGVSALLAPASQEIDERPAFRTDRSERNTIQIRDDRVVASRLPASAHLDFQSANGIYYWEIFFHAPVLIAQALNNAQRFADARQWYEYVFDPTEPERYWRFLPFLAVDLAALADRSRRDMAALADQLTAAGFNEPAGLADALALVLTDLERLTPAFRENRPLDEAELVVLDRLASSQLHMVLADAVTAARARITPRIREPKRSLWRGVVQALEQLQERTALVADMRRHYDLVGDRDSLIGAYRDDPFDPHAIADLRPVAHRRAVVMAYIDNLLDWGDMLFRQYTGESIDEARMLYIFAWDLLGLRPELPGQAPLSRPLTYRELTGDTAGDNGPADDLVAEVTGGGSLLEGSGRIHAGVASDYFRIPDNSVFTAYWDRVEDRLRKIRQSLDILGISQPLPLFEPPIDPMELVRAVAAGVDAGQAVAGTAAVPVPHYRFESVFRRAQELVDRLRQFGGDLQSVLERKDSEELTLLQNRQETVLLEMTTAIKNAQVEAASATLRELEASRDATNDRITHYKDLTTSGLSALEEAQIGIMGTAAALHLTAGILKVASGIAYAVPQNKIGPFIVGVEWGGQQLGKVLSEGAEIPQVLGEGFSITGELLGVRAEQERTRQDWQFQLTTAENDLAQIGHQIAGAEQQLAIARREAEIHAQDIAHNKAIATLLKEKFTGAELYTWMAGRLSGLYFQAYSMAYDTARAAERAMRFERGLNDAETTYIRPLYWDSRRAGLLAGDSLGLDLDRLGQAYADTGARGLEITKQVSLLELDPAAALRLAASGACEFALTEELYDRDFPGHYCRQIRSLAVSFIGDTGEAMQPNATLTQIGHKTVLAPDPKAVRHLLDPKQDPPDTLRGDWRASQQIALSQVGDLENNGLFELRYDDARYLPFEGTGAVSTWRLELNGRKPANLRDVVLTVRYSATQGGEVFANAVKGMLKPYPAARFIDVATQFPEQWQEFTEGDGTELTLPITADLLPGLTGRQITGIYPHYGSANGTRLTLGGNPLAEGKLLLTPDLRVDDSWTFALEGDKQSLTSLGLVLTYRAAAA